MENTIIQQGSTFRVYDSSISAMGKLPVGTYRIEFNEMSGYSLRAVDNLTPGGEAIYGNHDCRVERAIQAYDTMERSLGVLMSGDKGMGKSLMIRMLVAGFQSKYNMPAIIVDDSTPGLAEYIDTLGEAIIVFDEFEKRFKNTEQGGQNQFLSLFDGVSTKKRVYLVTVNNTYNLSDFILNRPGRFHYHMRFSYPTPSEVRRYITEQVPGVSEENIASVIKFTSKLPLNYDHLRAVAFELRLGGDFGDIIRDLNIKNLSESSRFRVTLTDPDGNSWATYTELDMFSQDQDIVTVRRTGDAGVQDEDTADYIGMMLSDTNPDYDDHTGRPQGDKLPRSLQVVFTPRDGKFNEATGDIEFDAESIRVVGKFVVRDGKRVSVEAKDMKLSVSMQQRDTMQFGAL